MPAVNSGLILVTGASGFVGTYTAGALVDAGYTVRGVVRSDAKGKYLQGLFPGKPVEYVVVPDMNEDGAYDSAVAGIDGVVHAASPLNAAHAGDPQEVIGPAVAGVTGILGSLTKAGHKGRIVTISSVAAIASVGLSGPVRFTDEDWNEESVKRCTELGAQATGVEKYAASKVYAERAFWKFFNDNKGQKFDGTAINPGYIFGPPTQFTDSESAVVGSNALFLPFFRPGLPTEVLSKDFGGFVDVRDVAASSVRVLQTPVAAGERFNLCASPMFGNDFAIAVGKTDRAAGLTSSNSDPAFRAALNAKAVVFDSTKIQKVLGFKFRDPDATLEDTAKAIAAKL